MVSVIANLDNIYQIQYYNDILGKKEQKNNL